LAQGDDILELTVAYSDESKRATREVVKISWDEMFRVVGPRMYGYILRKREGYGESTYPFQDTLQEHIRATIIDRVQNRKIRIEETQIDSCILQFKELGLLRFAENHDDGKVFRGVTLTEEGERRLTRLSTRFRSKVEPVTTEAQRSSRKKKKGDGAVSRADTAL
jgi:DNA-binding PadR family transcriptional regulator